MLSRHPSRLSRVDFPDPGGTRDGNILSLGDIQIDPLEHVESGFKFTVILVDSLQGDDGSAHWELGPRRRAPGLPLPAPSLGLELRSTDFSGAGGASLLLEAVADSGL